MVKTNPQSSFANLRIVPVTIPEYDQNQVTELYQVKGLLLEVGATQPAYVTVKIIELPNSNGPFPELNHWQGLSASSNLRVLKPNWSPSDMDGAYRLFWYSEGGTFGPNDFLSRNPSRPIRGDALILKHNVKYEFGTWAFEDMFDIKTDDARLMDWLKDFKTTANNEIPVAPAS